MKNSILITALLAGFLISGCNGGSLSYTEPPQQMLTVLQNYKVNYKVIFDSGSSGNRIYLYKITNDDGIAKITSVFESSNKTPLASFATNPNTANVAIIPLLNYAKTQLEKERIDIAQVEVNILATAGMRLIAESSQIAIYNHVAQAIQQQGFKLGETKTISGQEEGLYSWIDVNYLKNNFKNGSNHTNGIVEIGGASAQVAFATSDEGNFNVIETIINGKRYNVFSTSFLGLGQDQARDQMNLMDTHNECYPTKYSSSLIQGKFNYETCNNTYNSIISQPEYSLSKQIHTVPEFNTQNFVGLGSVYYALNFWKLDNNPLTRESLISNIQNTCNLDYSVLQITYPNAYKLYNQCANASSINSFLFDGLQFKDERIIAIDTINNLPLTWTLGYVLNSLKL